jgi:hypothetical protein
MIWVNQYFCHPKIGESHFSYLVRLFSLGLMATQRRSRLTVLAGQNSGCSVEYETPQHCCRCCHPIFFIDQRFKPTREIDQANGGAELVFGQISAEPRCGD